jgi:hypothetical protein
VVAFAHPGSAQIAALGSPDIHVDQSGTVVSPGDVAEDIEVLMPAVVDLGPLPDGAEVNSYTPLSATEQYFTLGHTLALPGGVTARPRDVVLWDGVSYTIALDGSMGFPDGAAIDALAIDPFTFTSWLSFDTTIDLSGNVFRDADVFDELFNKVFDATAAGVPAGMDVDAVGMIPPTNDVLLSFDTGGTLGGITFADEDVLRYDPDGDTWMLVVDTSATQPNWAAADLDALTAVPEPAGTAMLATGLAAMFLFARHRRAAEGFGALTLDCDAFDNGLADSSCL